jgi:antitoxin YefM
MAMPASTPVPISEAKTHLSELARRVRQQHERITLTRNGEPEAVLLSVDDLEGLEMTLEILGDTSAVSRISESLANLGRGERGVDLATVRADLARRRHQGT